MSQTRYLKSMITPTLVEPTENHEAGVASGVWSLGEQLEARRGSVWPVPGVTNPSTLIEGNFSTFLWAGSGSARSITTGIDTANKGGLVWIKKRSGSAQHTLKDTVRGTGTELSSSADSTAGNDSAGLTAFSSTGFSLGTDDKVNASNSTYVGWTFKKAPKFFDVVKYEGTGSARTVAHSLGGTVGMILIKNLDQSDNWAVYHRGADASAPEDKYLILNSKNAVADSANWWNDTAPTTSVFTVGTNHAVNANGENYVAYLFAHETGSDSMIQCGVYDGTGNATDISVNLGWEPQFLMLKNLTNNGAGGFEILDSMRGTLTNGTGDDEVLSWSEAAAIVEASRAEFTATGFNITTTNAEVNENNHKVIYMAIRRPNMATITDATEVFTPFLIPVNNAIGTVTPHIVDFGIIGAQTGSDKFYIGSRLTGPERLNTTSIAAGSNTSNQIWDRMNGFWNDAPNGYMSWNWNRAKGFCDVVAYTGTGSARTVAHGLTVAPEMMWVKRRDGQGQWAVYHSGTDSSPAEKYLYLNLHNAVADATQPWNDTAPTASVFTVGAAGGSTNDNNETFIAYLFATLAGISKLGSVTHSGSSTDVDCGFSAGARFVLLKRTDATGGWYIWDSVRGIIAGNDPYLLLNDTAAEVTNTDLIDPLASGFQISGDFTDGDYIFYAIA